MLDLREKILKILPIYRINISINDNTVYFWCSIDGNMTYNLKDIVFTSIKDIYKLKKEDCISDDTVSFKVKLSDTNLLENILKKSSVNHNYKDRRDITNNTDNSTFEFKISNIDDVITVINTFVNYGNRTNKIKSIIESQNETKPDTDYVQECCKLLQKDADKYFEKIESMFLLMQEDEAVKVIKFLLEYGVGNDDKIDAFCRKHKNLTKKAFSLIMTTKN